MKLGMRMINAQRVLGGGDVVAKHKVKLIFAAVFAPKRRIFFVLRGFIFNMGMLKTLNNIERRKENAAYLIPSLP